MCVLQIWTKVGLEMGVRKCSILQLLTTYRLSVDDDVQLKVFVDSFLTFLQIKQLNNYI